MLNSSFDFLRYNLSLLNYSDISFCHVVYRECGQVFSCGELKYSYTPTQRYVYQPIFFGKTFGRIAKIISRE